MIVPVPVAVTLKLTEFPEQTVVVAGEGLVMVADRAADAIHNSHMESCLSDRLGLSFILHLSVLAESASAHMSLVRTTARYAGRSSYSSNVTVLMSCGALA